MHNLSLLGWKLQTIREKLRPLCYRMQLLKLYIGPRKDCGLFYFIANKFPVGP